MTLVRKISSNGLMDRCSKRGEFNGVAKRVMNEEGVARNDLWAPVKPHQAEVQIPRNVHFQRTGSVVMVNKVAEQFAKSFQNRTL